MKTTALQTGAHIGPDRAASRHVFASTATTVLVPMLNLGVAADMIQLAGMLAAGPHQPHRLHGSEIAQSITPITAPHSALRTSHSALGTPRVVVVGVVEVPADQPLATGLVMARSYRALLDFLPSEVEVDGVGVRVDRLVKVARDVPSAVHDAANDEQAGLALLYWKGYARNPKRHTYGSIADSIMRNPPCDVALVRPEAWRDIRRVLLPVRGGPSAERALALALTLAENLHVPMSVMHNVPSAGSGRWSVVSGQSPDADSKSEIRNPKSEIGQTEARGEEPYIIFNEILQAAEKQAAAPIERVLTSGDDPAASLINEVRQSDFLIMGTSSPQPPTPNPQPPISLAVSEKKGPPLLLLHSPEPLDLAGYRRKVRTHRSKKTWDDMPFENWFVENTFHSDEFKDPAAFIEAKKRSGQTLSVGLLTSNDAEHLFSTLTGLKRVLMEMHPIADQIVVVDAGSTDGTPDIARQLGVEVYSCAELLPDKGNLHGRGESWWKSLAALNSDVLVWLDPRAQRFHPSTAMALAGPLLRTPTLQLVKAYGQPDDGRRKHTNGNGHGNGHGNGNGALRLGDDYAPVDMSWGGFVTPRPGDDPVGQRIRVQSLKAEDLLALDAGLLAALPPRTILQAFSPSLAAVIAPFGRDVAGRRTAMLSLPAFTGENFEVGLLLSVAAEYGPRCVAQVELRHAQPAPPPQPGLRNAMDLLGAISRRLQDPQMRLYAAEVAERLQRSVQGQSAQPPEAALEVRALGPVERPPMLPILK